MHFKDQVLHLHIFYAPLFQKDALTSPNPLLGQKMATPHIQITLLIMAVFIMFYIPTPDRSSL